MATKKYPVGTQIKYIGPCKKCKNQLGKIVETLKYGYRITLPQSTCSAFIATGNIICNGDDIEPSMVKGQQLLFSFMGAMEGT